MIGTSNACGKRQVIGAIKWTRLPDPETPLPGGGVGVAYSPDGNELSVGHAGSPYWSRFDVSGDIPIRLPDPDIGSRFTNVGNGFAYVLNGTRCIVAHNSVPFISRYDMTGDIPVRLPALPDLPTYHTTAVAVAPDESEFCVTSRQPPYIHRYTMDGIPLPAPDDQPNGQCNDVCYSPDGRTLLVSCYNAPCYVRYDLTHPSLLRLPDIPESPITGNGFGVAYFANGSKIAAAHSSQPLIYVFDIEQGFKQNDPATRPVGAGNGIAISPNGREIVITHASTPFVSRYDITGDAPRRLDDPQVGIPGSGKGIAFSPKGNEIAIAHSTAPFFTRYRISRE